MRHPSETASKDVLALFLLVIAWLGPVYVVRNGYEHIGCFLIYVATIISAVSLAAVYEKCGAIVRPMIFVTAVVIALVGCVAAIAAIFLLPTAFITLAARASLLGYRDAATLTFLYLIPAGLMFVGSCRWIDKQMN